MLAILAFDTIGLRGTDLVQNGFVTPVRLSIVGGEDETVDFWKHFLKTLTSMKIFFLWTQSLRYATVSILL